MANTNGWKRRIEINPKILAGKPLIKGTRMGVDFILELLAQGWKVENILKNYPKLKKEDIRAAFSLLIILKWKDL
ncbi:MAG: DUF433 domain-containing protein [Nanoarchaeota archaeon]